MAIPAHLLAAGLIAGLAGGLHCAAMCGGVVTAIALPPVSSLGPRPLTRRQRARLLAWSHAGRIATYSLAGVLAGGLGTAAQLFGGAWAMQLVLYFLANSMLLVLGLRLAGVPAPLALEGAGRRIWGRVQPWFLHLYPARNAPQALALGAAWGCMPCGLVYGVLALALVSGSALAGALIMLAFGLGTLPHLLLAAFALRRLRAGRWGARIQRLAGAVVLLAGIAGMARLLAPVMGTPSPLLGLLCRIAV